MTFSKLVLTALLIGSPVSAALADSDDRAAQGPLAAFQQSIGIKAAAPAAAPVIEGRQTTPIATPASVVDAYLIDRNGPSLH